MRFLALLALVMLAPLGAQAYTVDFTPDACLGGRILESHKIGRLCDRNGTLHPIRQECSDVSNFVIMMHNGTPGHGNSVLTCRNYNPADPECPAGKFLYVENDVAVCMEFEKKFCGPGFVETLWPRTSAYLCEPEDKIDPATLCTSDDLSPYTFDTFDKEFKRDCVMLRE